MGEHFNSVKLNSPFINLILSTFFTFFENFYNPNRSGSQFPYSSYPKQSGSIASIPDSTKKLGQL